jgi:inosine-uridine nucleoside N-ribohydrolase
MNRQRSKFWRFLASTTLAALVTGPVCHAQSGPTHQGTLKPSAQRVVLDTDIGDDIDDAFALALALSSPEVKLMGVVTAWGDSGLRARLAERFLCETGEANIPVFAGMPTVSKTVFSQREWAQASSESKQPDSGAGIDFMLNTIRRYPGQITLIAIAPLSNVGALIDKDPATFRKLKKVVMMGGSIRRGYDYLGQPADKPSSEYNIQMDVSSANKLLASGVPVFMLPLDSTQLKLDAAKRARLFNRKTPLTGVLSQLYSEWSAVTKRRTPVLFDAMAVAYDVDPKLCPMTPMRLHVDRAGFTRVVDGTPNVNVCLKSNSGEFFSFYIPRILDAKNRAKASSSLCTKGLPGK